MRPLSSIIRICTSRWLGTVSEVRLATALARGGMITAAGGSGWRSETAR
jgi:hypothetical protein